MLNLINDENYAIFDEICKKKAKIKIKFQKMKGTFLDSIPWLKSHQPPLIGTCLFVSSKGHPHKFPFENTSNI